MEAAASVLGQSWTDLELIIADDGSTDGIEEDIKGLSADPRVRWHRLVHTGMPGAVRNTGASLAGGKWLAFLDSDDLWLPEKLEQQMKHISSLEGIRCAHCREIWLRGDRVVSQKSQKHARKGDVFEDSLKKCIIGPSTVVMETELFYSLGGFREDMEIAEDYELWLRLTSQEHVGYLDEPLVIKRSGHGKDQLSEKYGHIEVFRVSGLLDLVESQWFFDDPQRQKQAEAELVRKCRIYSAGARKRGLLEEAEEYESIAKRYS